MADAWHSEGRLYTLVSYVRILLTLSFNIDFLTSERSRNFAEHLLIKRRDSRLDIQTESVESWERGERKRRVRQFFASAGKVAAVPKGATCLVPGNFTGTFWRVCYALVHVVISSPDASNQYTDCSKCSPDSDADAVRPRPILCCFKLNFLFTTNKVVAFST